MTKPKMKVATYKLEVKKIQDVEIPVGAQILHIQKIGLSPFIFALVNPENINEPRTFQILKTNETFDTKNKKYIGSYEGGIFDFHLFEIIKP